MKMKDMGEVVDNTHIATKDLLHGRRDCPKTTSFLPSLKSFGLLSTAAIAAAPLVPMDLIAGDRPNIIFILADDQGPDGVSCYGGKTFAGCTPRLDALAENGMRFTNCYAAATCSPARALYLSGQYPFLNGVITNDGCNSRFDANKPCLTKVLKDAGYSTGGSGKSVDDSFYSKPGEKPIAADFMDEYLSGGSGDYVNKKKYKFKGPSKIDPSPEKYPYFPDAMQAFAIDFIRRNRPSPENGNKPFYLYYSLIHPHAPLLPTPDSKPLAKGDKMSGQENYRDYVKYIDKLVGGIVDELKTHGILENTLIVYTADNGCWGSGLQGTLPDPKTGKQRKISGKKSDEQELREGTSLVPLIVHWPTAIKNPSVREEIIDFTDFLATFADVAGAQIPTEWKVHGHSFAPLMRGSPDWKPREWTFVQHQYNWCVRGNKYRLNRDGRLFDMGDAPFSMKEVRQENETPEIAAVRKQFQAVLDEFDPENGLTYESTQDYYQDDKGKGGKSSVWKWKSKHWDWARRWEYQFSGDNADPDKDGVTNIIERAFGWDPNKGTDKMPAVKFKPGTREIEMPPLAKDSDVIISVLTADGKQPPEDSDPSLLRFNAVRATKWDTPPALDPARPELLE